MHIADSRASSFSPFRVVGTKLRLNGRHVTPFTFGVERT